MKNIIAIACMVLSVMTSCSSIESLTFDQLNPAAQANFPASVRQIAVVNNMPQIPAAANNIMTLGDTEGDGKQSASALASALADSKYFDEVIICDSALNHKKIAKPTDDNLNNEAQAFPVHTLKQEEVTELCQMLNADMLFSLDRILINKEKKYIRYLGMQEKIPVIRVKVTPVVSLHVPTRSKPIQIIHTTDSLDWTVDNVPSDKEMLKEAAEFGAHIMSNQLVPYWTQTSRIYYTGGMARHARCSRMRTRKRLGIGIRNLEIDFRQNEIKESKDAHRFQYSIGLRNERTVDRGRKMARHRQRLHNRQ